MKLAVISDTHIGDPESTLVKLDKSRNPVDGCKLSCLIEALGKDNDYLIFLGDIMDFAVNDYGDVYRMGAYFFTRLRNEKIAKRFVYIPGNHDYNIWDTIEYQSNVINQLSSNQNVRPFKMSVPLLIDDRTGVNFQDRIKLAGVRKRSSEEPYGGMFLDYLIADNIPGTPGYIPFIIAFPNVYLFTDDGSIIMTHGQYLESYWSMTAEVFRIIKDIKHPFCMKDYVAVNFPLCQLGSTGIGQAGPFTATVLESQKDITSGKCVLIRKYILEMLEYLVPHKLPKFIRKIIYNAIAESAVKRLRRIRNSDYISDLTSKKDADTIKRFNDYIDSSIEELRLFETDFKKASAPTAPETFLFGHTHVPVNSSDNKTHEYNGKKIKLLNSGGWLEIHGETEVASGGEVFIYESGKGFTSKRINVNK
jgi:predicted phosphodiesterase